MKKFNRITIIGVGLIGGSIGLACKKNNLADEVVGICRRKISAKAALQTGAVDIATLNYKQGLKNAGLVIIAVPVGRIVDIAKNVVKHSEGPLILTDVGSTKEKVVDRIEKMLPKRIKFIGSHPMAGSEKSGVNAANWKLFKNSVCIITKTKKTDKNAFKLLSIFWKNLGAVTKVLDTKSHDSYISFVSHLPHVAAIALTVSADPRSLEFASTGFKDTTRIAGSDPYLWQDIFMTNKTALLSAMNKYKTTLEGIENNIRCNNTKNLIYFLKKSKAIRDKLR